MQASKSSRGSEDGVGDEDIDKSIVKYDTSPKEEENASFLSKPNKVHHDNIYTYYDQYYA